MTEIRANHPVPAGTVSPAALLPFMQAVVDAAVDATVAQVQAAGGTISCRKGCSACCRAQPVPVTPTEASALADLVDAQPAARRTALRERFADRVRRLQAAGLLDSFLRRSPLADAAQARAAAVAYHRLGLACPFLEDDACSIHAQRPFSCRQYLVTSPAALCTDPLHQPVAVVPSALRATSALLRATEPLVGRPQLTIPLTLALVHVDAHADELRRTGDAQQTLGRWLAAMG